MNFCIHKIVYSEVSIISHLPKAKLVWLLKWVKPSPKQEYCGVFLVCKVYVSEMIKGRIIIDPMQESWMLNTHWCAWGVKASLSDLIPQRSYSKIKLSKKQLMLVMIEKGQNTPFITVCCIWGSSA